MRPLSLSLSLRSSRVAAIVAAVVLAGAAAGRGAGAQAAGATTNLIPLFTATKAPAVAPPPAATTTTTQPAGAPASGSERLHRAGGAPRKWVGFDYASLPKGSDT